jgi:hypothetical protein
MSRTPSSSRRNSSIRAMTVLTAALEQRTEVAPLSPGTSFTLVGRKLRDGER